jgi:hypothetical protein
MTPITILQSAADARPDWVSRCMASVVDWSQQHGYRYHCTGDELFDWVTPELGAKLRDRTSILADLARLRWIEAELSARGGLVVWIDADTLVVDPSWRVPDSEHTFFGEECWVQPTAERSWRAYQSPHNAFMGFTAASPVLGFLSYLSESIIERADAAHIAPQMVGPKLLKALNNLAQFTLVPEAGAVSPELLTEWVGDAGPATACYEKANRPALALVNLCSSLTHSEEAVQRAEQYVSRHGA